MDVTLYSPVSRSYEFFKVNVCFFSQVSSRISVIPSHISDRYFFINWQFVWNKQVWKKAVLEVLHSWSWCVSKLNAKTVFITGNFIKKCFVNVYIYQGMNILVVERIMKNVVSIIYVLFIKGWVTCWDFF